MHLQSTGISLRKAMKYRRPADGNKTRTRQQRFAEGSLERKVAFQDKQQSRFDQETERMIRKFRGIRRDLRNP